MGSQQSKLDKLQMIVDYIGFYNTSYQMCPTQGEIAIALGWEEVSRSAVNVYIKELEGMGYIVRGPGHVRNLQLTELASTARLNIPVEEVVRRYIVTGKQIGRAHV